MIEPINRINNRIQADPQEDHQEGPQEVVEMVVDHTIVTEGEVGEIGIRLILR